MSTVTPSPPSFQDSSAEREISLRDNGRLMTPEEFDRIDVWDENFNYELVNGVLIVSPAAGLGEVNPGDELGRLLRNYSAANPGIMDLTAYEITVRLPNSRRRVDRVVWAGLGRRPKPKRDVPTIAIEFVSRSRRDRIRDYITKRAEYLDAGVREYWVIDRFQSKMTVFQRIDGTDTEQEISENAIYRTPILPGFELPLKSLLNLAGGWDEFDEEDEFELDDDC